MLSALKDAVAVVNEGETNSKAFDENVMKSVIRNAVSEMKSELLKESRSIIMEIVSSFNKKFEETVSSFQKKFEDISTKFHDIKHEIRSEIMKEMEDREYRKNNLIIFGIPEPTIVMMTDYRLIQFFLNS